MQKNLRISFLFCTFAPLFKITLIMERIFKRKLYDKLLDWKNTQNGKTALLIEGARRVGKSTIVELFAKQEYESYILIDFNRVGSEIKSLFNDLMDLDFLFLQLQSTYNVSLHTRKSVIIFDEVQQCPQARQAIKYLVADGRYDYIETGSLISIKKNTKGITIPSEEDRIIMYPMDYEEFRWALGDTNTLPLLRHAWERRIPMGAAHRIKMREFRLYMLVGGMPQAVNEYLDTNNLSAVDKVKRSIIQIYLEDFEKIDESGRLELLFQNIPAQLSSNGVRYYPYQILGQVDETKKVELLKDLKDSKTVLFSYHSNDPNVGLALTKDVSKFKLYMADTGLFITMAFWDKGYTENIIYQKLLSDKLEANLGYIYENVVAQMLTANDNELFYYTFPKDTNHNYEIDFLLSHGAKLWPIEVKSSGYKTHASLDAFCEKYSSRVDRRFLIYTKDYNRDAMTTILPTYMVPVMD